MSNISLIVNRVDFRLPDPLAVDHVLVLDLELIHLLDVLSSESQVFLPLARDVLAYAITII